MKTKIFAVAVTLLLIFVLSSTVCCQNPVKERPDLIQDLIEQSKIFSFEGEEELDGIPENVSVTIYQFDGTAEEALKFVNEVLFKDDNRKPEMEYNKMNLSEMLIGLKTAAEQGYSPGLDEAWIKKAEDKIVKLEDVEQVSYYGYLEYPNMDRDVTIQNPFFNPVSFKIVEGTYIIYSESKFDAKAEDIKGNKIELADKLAEEFLQGSWKIQKRSEEEEMPKINIEVDELIGSFEEAEIDAVRYLFSGQIKVNGESYKAYTELDPANVFAYPIRIISILKEEGMDYKLDIWLEDIDKGINLSIYSDLEDVYERALGVELSYSDYEQGDYYETDYTYVDYLIRE